MRTNQEVIELCKKEMIRLEYKKTTIKSYTNTAKQLANFAKNKSFTDISFSEIKDFFEFLRIRRQYKPKTVHLAIFALTFLYNKVLDVKYDFAEIPREKPRHIDIPFALSPQEVIKAINAIENFKLRTIVALIYSSGLKARQVTNIRLSDIDFHRKRLRIYSTDRRDSVSTVLSETLIPQLKEYLRNYKPEKLE